MPPYVEEQEKEKAEDVVVASYVCNDLEKSIVSNVSLLSQVPVIDMEKLLPNYGDDDDTELQKLHLACKDWGFFQLINHGVSSSLLEKVRSEIQGFFNLPIEEKKQFERQVGNLEGYGEMLVSSQNIESLVGMFYLITQPTHLRQPHLLPKFPLSLRKILQSFRLFVQLCFALPSDMHLQYNVFNPLIASQYLSLEFSLISLCPDMIEHCCE